MNNSIERYVIKYISGSKANQVEEFDFSKNQLTIGRASENDIQFDPEQEVIVSRQHGTISKVSTDPLKFTITDNNSRNGIFVNKTRVKGTVVLQAGDEVQLGLNGPVFSFDIYPRPQDMMSATRVVEIPTSIKATTVSDMSVIPAAEPAKVGLGKQTVERMLVAERKKSYSSMGIGLGALILVLGILGYTFRNNLFGHNTTTIIKPVVDSLQLRKKSPDIIAKENTDRVVKIEFGWQLFDASTNDELWHLFTTIKGADGLDRPVALYIENANGKIEPYLVGKKSNPYGLQIGLAGYSGSGFIVSEDGFILTNRHVGAGWNTSWNFQNYDFPGLLVQFDATGKLVVTNKIVNAEDVGRWVPAEASMIAGHSVSPGAIIGKNTYMNVVFAGTAIRRPVVSTTASDDHDVALIKVDMPGSLSKVSMKDTYDQIQPGQSVTVMGYPGVAPEQFVVRKSNDPFHPNSEVTTIPTPTVTPGAIGRIIPASSDKNLTYSAFGDSYQLTINATGPGNSGGPLFDDEGNVIGIYYAGTSPGSGPQISYAVPIKYGLELMGPKKVN